MRIAIVDDSASDIRLLQGLLEQYAEAGMLRPEIRTYADAPSFLAEFQRGRFQICFLDICMEALDGISLARRLRQTDTQCLIVFTTTSAEFAVDAYSVRAFHYLLKPLTQALVDDAMALCVRELGGTECVLRIKSGREWRSVSVADIVYTDYSNHFVYLHTKSDPNNPLRTGSTFDRFAPELLAYPQFLNCYRNMLVNLDEVTRMNPDSFQMNNGVTVPMWRNRKKELREQYAAYMFRKMNGG